LDIWGLREAMGVYAIYAITAGAMFFWVSRANSADYAQIRGAPFLRRWLEIWQILRSGMDAERKNVLKTGRFKIGNGWFR
jgi:hypothetical protein